MSDLIAHSIDLVVQPQEVLLTQAYWRPDDGWREYILDDLGLVRAWAFTLSEAERLASKVVLPKHEGREAYGAVFAAEGMAVKARHPDGLVRFQALANEMRQLAEDEWGVPCMEVQDWPDLEVRGVHLDLKYQMHRVDYLTNVYLDELHRARINTLLLEYEDKFPYQKYPELQAVGAFTPEELKQFLAKARSLGIRIIPLFQTLGHLEFVLQHERFRHLRGGEAGEYVTETIPNHPEALRVIFELIDEVLEYHQEDEWFHIGGDEPWYLRKLHRKGHATLAESYGRHMKAVAEYVISKGKRPLLYDDVFRDIDEAGMKEVLALLPKEMILCFWDYRGTIGWPGERARKALENYRHYGFDVLGLACHNWGAVVPYYEAHTNRNTLEMIHLSKEIGALGIINTAWACFRVPIPYSGLGIAITGARSWKARTSPYLHDVEVAYCHQVFGVRDRRIVCALYQLGMQLELRTDLGRPITLPHFFYMDAVVQYGGHEFREKLGSSLDLYDNADCRYIVARKLELLECSDLRLNGVESLRKLEAIARTAELVLLAAEPEITRGRELFKQLLWVAKFKQHCARRMLVLLGDRELDPASLIEEGKELKTMFSQCMDAVLIAEEIQRDLSYYFEGEMALMQEQLNMTIA